MLSLPAQSDLCSARPSPWQNPCSRGTREERGPAHGPGLLWLLQNMTANLVASNSSVFFSLVLESERTTIRFSGDRVKVLTGRLLRGFWRRVRLLAFSSFQTLPSCIISISCLHRHISYFPSDPSMPPLINANPFLLDPPGPSRMLSSSQDPYLNRICKALLSSKAVSLGSQN